MPNHIKNRLSVTGDEDKVKLFFESIRKEKADENGETSAIDFEKIIPMPKELNIESGSSSYQAKDLIEKCKTRNIKEYVMEHMDEFKQSVRPYIENYIKYGYTDWYDWSIAKWGTKWNAYDVVDMTSARIVEFSTAWATPIPVMAELSKQHPEVKIKVDFADEDLGSNCGWYELIAGGIVDDYMPEGDEALRYACDVWGYDYNEIVRERDAV